MAHGVSIVTSTSAEPTAIRSAMVPVRAGPSRGTLKSTATTRRGRDGSGQHRHQHRGRGIAQFDRPARGDPQIVEVMGVGRSGEEATSPARAGAAPTADPLS